MIGESQRKLPNENDKGEDLEEQPVWLKKNSAANQHLKSLPVRTAHVLPCYSTLSECVRHAQKKKKKPCRTL